ncbi:MAG: bacillithiol system redox-active protein YtxJ [Gemmatimonadetes bacterium]|nr:bacillithiol system redox-active protein YtxJ [Gemmatimonadota bacterium]
MTPRTLPNPSGVGWRDVVGGKGVAVIYKHSPYCGLSTSARAEVCAFVADHPTLPIWEVDVVGQRELSEQIAQDLGIRHESPQAIVLVDGATVWFASHRGVTHAALLETIERQSGL